MNWITRIIKASDKIKSAIKKRVSKEEIKNSKWMSPCCGSNPILKSSIFNEKELNTCPNCDKHYPFPPRQDLIIFMGLIIGKKLILPNYPMTHWVGLVEFTKKN